MIVTYVGGGASSLVLRSSAICTYVTTAKSIQVNEVLGTYEPFPHSTSTVRVRAGLVSLTRDPQSYSQPVKATTIMISGDSSPITMPG